MCHTVLYPLVVLVIGIAVYPFLPTTVDIGTIELEREVLPNSVHPNHYQILLEPRWDDFTFSGIETIDITIVNATKEIVFHGYQIKLLECSLHFPSSSIPIAIFPKSIEYDNTLKRIHLKFANELEQGEAKLVFSFSGLINDQMSGFYRSQYQLENGELEYLLTTQMEPTDARRVFPCWDEPALKATFEISLRVPSDILALSNMPEISTKTISPTTKQINFAVTPRMSTYLVAFSLGNFEYLETYSSNTLIRVYTPPGKKEQGKFALQVARDSLEFYNEYFAINYPLPKLDLIAIPDFAAGAMENWGLITFRENALLIDDHSSGISSRQRVAYVIAHEIAHQWFGNLVTMNWWKELWLNEGFATWVGNLAVHHLFPEWNIWLQFGADYYSTAQSLDGLLSSHPIEVDVASGDQIMEIFDAISYCKGASVIRMVEKFVGEKEFKAGLHLYLTRHKYSNAATEDLWNALSESSGKDVSEFMHNWTAVSGYPIVRISKDPETSEMLVKQERFLSSAAANPPSQSLWNIPLHIRSQSNSASFQLSTEETSFYLPDSILESSWLYANENQIGFYRTVYEDAEMKKSLFQNVMQLDASERMGLQNDWFALSNANLMEISEAVQLASQYIEEESFAVWADLSSNLANLLILWEEEHETNHILVNYCKSIFTSVLDRIGWENEAEDSDLRILLRTLMMKYAGALGDEKTITKAKTLFKEHYNAVQDNRKGMQADLQGLVFDIVMRNGSEEEFNQLMNLYNKSESHEEKIRLLTSMALAKDSQLIERVLHFSISDNVRPQDSFYAFVSTSKSAKGRQVAWKFLMENWEIYVKKFADGQFLFPRIISYATKFHSTKMADEVQEFFSTHPVDFHRTLNQIQESIRADSLWLSLQREKFSEFLLQEI